MAICVCQRDILDLALDCEIQDYPYWSSSDRRVTSWGIDSALETNDLMAPDDDQDPNTPMTAEQHAACLA